VEVGYVEVCLLFSPVEQEVGMELPEVEYIFHLVCILYNALRCSVASFSSVHFHVEECCWKQDT